MAKHTCTEVDLLNHATEINYFQYTSEVMEEIRKLFPNGKEEKYLVLYYNTDGLNEHMRHDTINSFEEALFIIKYVLSDEYGHGFSFVKNDTVVYTMSMMLHDSLEDEE